MQSEIFDLETESNASKSLWVYVYYGKSLDMTSYFQKRELSHTMLDEGWYRAWIDYNARRPFVSYQGGIRRGTYLEIKLQFLDSTEQRGIVETCDCGA